jgi:sugar lactone lactonase YvrE
LWPHPKPSLRQRRGRPDGTTYFTDSSRRHDLEHYAIDVIENVGTGRDLRRAPDGRIDVLHSGLRFANGVALSPDGTYLVVAESGARVLVRVPVDGGEAGIFADDLPGHPDNVTTSPDSTFWVALPRPRSRALDTVHRLPRHAHQAVAHAARQWASAPARRSRVLELGPHGEIVSGLTVLRARYRSITGVRADRRRLYLGSLTEPSIAVLDLDDSGKDCG